MKKLLFFLILFLGIHYSGMAQNIELKVTKDSTLVNGNYSYAVNLNISGGQAPYNISLYKNWLSEDSKLITNKNNCNESMVRFDNLPKIDALYISVISISDRKGAVSVIRL